MPEIIDLRHEGAHAIEAFANEPEGPPPAPVSEAVASTLTYERHYGLREKPFSLSTDPRFLYRSASHAPVLRDLAAAIRRREGLIVLTGDIGTGKTTLCRAVLGQLDRKTFATFVPDPFVTREDLLKTMLIDFGVMSVDDLVKGRLKGASRPDLSYPLYEFLQSLEPLDAFAVLVIDEAQNLSLPLLEEIRILSDLEAGRKLLQVVLVGQPEFDDQLRLPRMRQILQRVTVHCELQPLDRDGLSGYVAHRLQTAGSGASQLRVAEDALDLVFAVSGGVPRVVNLVCDRALAHGERSGTFVIGTTEVRGALADLRVAAPPAVAVAAAPPAAGPEPAAAPEVMPAPAETVAAIDVDAASLAAPDAPATVPVGPAPLDAASTLDALMELPAVDLKVQVEERAERPSRRPPRASLSVARGKVWQRPPRFGALVVSSLVVLGATTGVSLVGYWLWLRPFVTEPIALPSVGRPATVLSANGLRALPVPDSSFDLSPAPVDVQSAGASPAAETWAVQAGVFSDPGRAGALVAHLVELGFASFQRDGATAGGGSIVYVGPVASRQEADRQLARVQQVSGLDQAMVRRLAPR